MSTIISRELLSTRNLQIQVVAGSLTVGVSAFIAVLLRIKARRLRKIALAIEDYSIVIALILSLGVVASNIIAAHYGLGKHISDLSQRDFVMFAKAFFASQIIWAIGIPVIKLSILMQYLRIFGVLRYIKVSVWVLITVTLAWGVMVVLVLLLKCQPLDYNWDKSREGHCINETLFYKIGTAINVASDFSILFLPMPAIRSLHVRLQQRLRVLIVFVIGSLSCAFSTARLVSLFRLKGNDITYELAIPCIWSAVEPCLGIVAACLASTGPIIEALKNSFQRSIMQLSTGVPQGERNFTLSSKKCAHRLGSTESIALATIPSPIDERS